MDYPGIHIGPEPTTDKFIAVVHGEESKVIKGNSLTAVDELPYAGLSTFGGGFLNKFEAALVNAPILKSLPLLSHLFTSSLFVSEERSPLSTHQECSLVRSKEYLEGHESHPSPTFPYLIPVLPLQI